MEATVVQIEKVQRWRSENDKTKPFRWSRWSDGNGTLWIVTLTFGFDKRGIGGANVELLNVDTETTVDITRACFNEWVEKGTLKRVDTPILL
jgi:hypothetical protein